MSRDRRSRQKNNVGLVPAPNNGVPNGGNSNVVGTAGAVENKKHTIYVNR